MTEKIRWYREVLELEPNSKLFFPLSRLLVEDDNPDEAIKILQHGLDRHPEYLEARLFLIELLHATGKKEECDRQVDKLGRMFASYAGFWQAWAACLSRENDEKDTASILRFLAAQFISGPIPLHDAITRGVQAILEERGSKDVSNAGKNSDKADIQADASLEDAGCAAAVLNTVQEDAPAPSVPENGHDIPLHAEEAGQSGEPSGLAIGPDAEEALTAADAGDGMLPETDLGMKPVVEMPGAEEAAPANEQPEPSMDMQAEPANGADVDDRAPAMAQDAPAAETPDGAQEAMHAAELPDAAVLEPGEEIIEATFDPEETQSALKNMAPEPVDEGVEETFTLRTRSMAEVLAEQGDIRGALDIYHELAAGAANEEEAEDINSRIATLQSRLELMKPVDEAHAGGEAGATSDREKLIGMLQTLARRVEARVNN